MAFVQRMSTEKGARDVAEALDAAPFKRVHLHVVSAHTTVDRWHGPDLYVEMRTNAPHPYAGLPLPDIPEEALRTTRKLLTMKKTVVVEDNRDPKWDHIEVHIVP